MEKFLSVTGFGNVHEVHFEAGYELARIYFDKNNLDFLECYEAYTQDKNSELGKHWFDAEIRANLALYGFNLQECSMLELEIADESRF